ncbi:unnamed protein product [Rotaria sp. Silwood2]|nr:unnamed protein product [Rotaria sp. Silwood2]
MNAKQQNGELRQTARQKNVDNAGSSYQSATKFIRNLKGDRLGNKEKLPPIPPARSYFDDDDDDVNDNDQDFELINEDSLPLKLFAGKKQSLTELSEESMSYLWLRRIKEIFLRMGDGKDEQVDDPFVEFDINLGKADLANTCDRYIENERPALTKKEELTPIKKGDDQLNFGNAIWWYSCDKANIYYQINSILRLENFELLMSYRYYLSDLCRMIEFMYQKRKDEYGDVVQIFYRSGHIDKKQLEKMRKQQKGQFISLLGFISATTNMNIAKGYAKKQHTFKDNEKVLFEIRIEPQQPCTAFAYISGISFHPEEEEVLFSMGSTFTVDDIVEPKNGENFYTIQLTASEIDKTLVDDIRTKAEECSPSGRAVLLAQYLMELGEYRAARKYLSSLLTQACDGGILANDLNLAAIYCCLGMTYARQCLHSDALKAFKQALNVQARVEYSNNNALANIHNNIGLAYIGLDHMDEAEETLAKALRIQLREVNSNQQHLASIYGNIGYVHYKKNDFKKALDAFSKAENIYKQSSSKIAHDELEKSLIKAEYLTNYGHLLSAYGSLTNAQKQYNEALKLYKSILPVDDPKRMQTHINIMFAHRQNKNYDEVTKKFEESTVQQLIDKQESNMFELNSSVRQATLAFLCEFVGACYAKQKLFDKAIRTWKRSLIFQRKARLEQLLLGTTDNISSTLTKAHESFISKSYQLAREDYLKSIKETNEPKDETIKQLPKDFCLGFLYAESYNRDKAIEYLTKMTTSLQKSDHDILFAVYLLLADMLKHQHEYKKSIENFDQALKSLKSLESQKDRVLEIEIKLARIDCLIKTDQNNEAITKLETLRKSLRSNDTDTKRISLKVIIYDTLARYFLMQKNYKLFDINVEESLVLKLRCFSQYHPSLTISLILMAQRHTQERRYREALEFYGHALEVQSLNLTDKHPKIRKICYAIGDIYCELDKLPNAMEKYNVAENKSLDVDEDDVLQQETTSLGESMEILMARISMHQHLAEYHSRKQAYKEAISEMNKIINLLEKKLPSSTFDINDETVIIQENIDASILIIRLQQLANCYLQLGDIRDTEQEDHNGYKAAFNIYTKLAQCGGEVESNKLAILCRKLSNYYEDLGENEEALRFLQETADLEQPTIATLYRLGRLNVACNKLDEAVTNYEIILSDKSINEQKELEQIVREKLNEVKDKVKNQERRWSTSSSESTDGLKPNDIIEIYMRLLPSEDEIQTRLKIAAMYRDNEMNDVKDLDDDGDTSNESREIAVQLYGDCLKATDDVLAKGVCYYNILSVYKNFIYEDDVGKAIVDDMINYLAKFNSSDRRLLITLALHFLKEYDNNKGYCGMKSNSLLQKFSNYPFNGKLEIDNALNIGYYLIKSNDLMKGKNYTNITTDNHKETLQLLTEKQPVDEEEAEEVITKRKLQNEIEKIKREAEEIELMVDTKNRDEIEKIKREAEEIELIEETKHQDEIEKMKCEGEKMKQIQEIIFQHKLKKMERETEKIRRIEETKRHHIHETYEAKRRKLELKFTSLSTKKSLHVFTSDYGFYNIDLSSYLQSFNINVVLNDNNYFNDNILNYIEHYSKQFSSYPKLNEEDIQKGFDQLIVNLLNTLNNSTSLKYLNTSSSNYLKNSFNPHCTFIYKNINIDIDQEKSCLKDFVVSLGNLMSPYISLLSDSMIEEILQYLTMILEAQHREKIYGFLSNYIHIKFFYVKKKSDSNWCEFFQSQELEMFTYSSEILSSIDTSTTATTTENTRKLEINKNTWKIFTNFLTMNTDFYQYTRLNIDPHDDLLSGRYMITKKLGFGVSSMVYLLEKNEDNHSVEDSPHHVMKILKTSEYSKCFRKEVKIAKKLKQFNDLNKFHLFFQDIIYSLSSSKAFVF